MREKSGGSSAAVPPGAGRARAFPRAARLLILLCAGGLAGLAGREWVAPWIAAHLARLEDRRVAGIIAGTVEEYVRRHGGRFPPLPMPREEGEDMTVSTSAREGLVAALLRPGEGPGYDLLWKECPEAREAPDLFFGWRGGILLIYGHTAIYDSGGAWYHVRMDTGGDGYVAHPNPAMRGGPHERLRRRAVVWSDGPDGNPDTWEDNVISP